MRCTSLLFSFVFSVLQLFSLSILSWFLLASLFLRKEIIYSWVRLLQNFLQCLWGRVDDSQKSKINDKKRSDEVEVENSLFLEYLTWIYFPGRLARILMLVSDLFKKIVPPSFRCFSLSLLSPPLSSMGVGGREVEVIRRSQLAWYFFFVELARDLNREV